MTLGKFFRADAVDDILVLELQDAVSSLADHSMMNELEEIREQRRNVGLTKVVIDLAQAPFFGSSLLEFIRVLWNDLQALDGNLVLCNPSLVGREVLEVANFDKVWPLLETREQALCHLGTAENVANWPAAIQEAFYRYEHGPTVLRDALEGLSPIQLRTPAPPGLWSAQQIVCHLADFEIVYADRMKRIVAEDKPVLLSGDPDLFAEKLAYHQREVQDELDVITAVRRQVTRFLKSLKAADFERAGIHSTDGPLTLADMLTRIAGHVPHHAKFIEAKKSALLGQ